MKEKVYFIPVADNEPDEEICRKLETAIMANDLAFRLSSRDMVASRPISARKTRKGTCGRSISR